MAKTRVTIADVARAAGVSPAAVSRALNQEQQASALSVATWGRLRAKAARMGYTPNWRAQALANQQTRMIGLLYTDRVPPSSSNNEHMLEAFHAALSAAGYDLVFTHAGPNAVNIRARLLDGRFDAAAVISHAKGGLPALLREARLPLVTINTVVDAPGDAVLADDVGGGRLAAEHLLGLGHRRIAFLRKPRQVGEVHHSFEQRFAGVAAAVAACPGASLVDRVEKPCVLAAAVVDGSVDATAVITASHEPAIELLYDCDRLRIAVPGRLSVVGFNDVYPVHLLHPPLTVVALPAKEMGARAAEVLLRRITDPKAARLTSTHPTTLVVRASTAPPSV